MISHCHHLGLLRFNCQTDHTVYLFQPSVTSYRTPVLSASPPVWGKKNPVPEPTLQRIVRLITQKGWLMCAAWASATRNLNRNAASAQLTCEFKPRKFSHVITPAEEERRARETVYVRVVTSSWTYGGFKQSALEGSENYSPPCMPIILCALLARTDLVVEWGVALDSAPHRFSEF